LAADDRRAKITELVFVGVFSALILAFFFSFLGANGVIVGNDPAVHLQTAENFLKIGKIQISDIAWYTPLYHLTLDVFIAFTGITSIGPTMVLMKAFTALIDWLVIFSVYIVAAKFLGKRIGVLAAAFMLLSFPFIELNAWGGYTIILSLAFIMLTVMFLTLPQKGIGNILVAFIFAFSVVLSHQIATFLAAFIIPPFAIIMFLKYRSTNSRVVLATLLGGVIAFLIYYVRPILPYLGQLVNILFFQLTVMKYEVPAVSFGSFMQSFGFALFFGFAGLAIAFFELRKRKSLSFYLLLVLTLIVPLFFSQSYLIGLNLAYPQFVDFFLPALAILAAVAFSFVMDTVVTAYFNNRKGWKRNFLKVVSVAIVVLLAVIIVVRFQTVSTGAAGVAQYYSTSDVSAYQMGLWINQNFPDKLVEGVATENPGNWLDDYTDRTVFAQTAPTVDWNVNAECMLALSYEFQNPLAMTRVYTEADNGSDETYLFINMVWQQAITSPIDNSYLFYRDPNGTLETFALASLNRTISMDEAHEPKLITVTYTGDNFKLNEIIQAENGTYPVTVTWQVSALNTNLNYATLLLNEYFNPAMEFNLANLPGILNWVNPLANPATETSGQLAITYFNNTNLAANNAIDIYSSTTQTAFAMKFMNLPNSGTLLSLENGVIDDLKWQWNAYTIIPNYTVSYTYQMLGFSMTSYPQLADPEDMNTLFSLTTANFNWECRNFPSIIQTYDIGFIVYDKTQFDPKILSSQWVQLVYSNNEYVVLKVKVVHPSPYIVNAAN
jgi:asparagine N-glycosylation enzyme membrane subunit Stt3